MGRIYLRLILLAAFVLSSPGVYAQEESDNQIARFQLAESFIRTGQFDRAIPLLQDLYKEDPTSHVFYVKLKESYEAVKKYEEAIGLIDSQIERAPVNPVLWSEKARFQYLGDSVEEAMATWNETIEKAPGVHSTYRVVQQSMLQVRLYEEAITILKQGREDLGDESLFHQDLGHLYGLTSQHELAMKEYLGLLAEDERQLGIVRNHVLRFAAQPGVLAAGISETETLVALEPTNKVYRELLAWLLLEADEYERALDETRALDRLASQSGALLFTFAGKASGAGKFGVAMDAYQDILDRYGESVMAPEAQKGIGDMHVLHAAKPDLSYQSRIKSSEKALRAYQTFLDHYPTHMRVPEVMLELAQLQIDPLNKVAEARETLGKLKSSYPDRRETNEAEFLLAKLSLRENNLNDALATLVDLEDRLRVGELAESARYQRALLHFYRGEFDAALTFVDVLKENTSTDIANDAIELVILLNENVGPDSTNSALNMLAKAMLLQEQRQSSEAMVRIDSLLLHHPSHPSAAKGRFIRAEILAAQGEYSNAIESLEQIPLIHPSSYLCDKSLFTAAEWSVRFTEDIDRAIGLYTRVVTEYPASVFTAEARRRARSLRGDIES